MRRIVRQEAPLLARMSSTSRSASALSSQSSTSALARRAHSHVRRFAIGIASAPSGTVRPKRRVVRLAHAPMDAKRAVPIGRHRAHCLRSRHTSTRRAVRRAFPSCRSSRAQRPIAASTFTSANAVVCRCRTARAPIASRTRRFHPRRRRCVRFAVIAAPAAGIRSCTNARAQR